MEGKVDFIGEVSNKFENLKARNEQLEVRVGGLENRNEELLKENEFLKKKYNSMQQEIIDFRNDQHRLEGIIFDFEKQIESAEKEKVVLQKENREYESTRKKEHVVFENEREAWLETESELRQKLRQANRIRSMPPQPKESSKMSSPTKSSEYEHSLRSANSAAKALKLQEKVVMELKCELKKKEMLCVQTMEKLEQKSLTVEKLEEQVKQLSSQNETLMEEQESYQILLHEKTVKGEFEFANSVLKLDEQHPDASPRSMTMPTFKEGVNLADELTRAFSPVPSASLNSGSLTEEPGSPVRDMRAEIRTLKDEKKTLKDENKALSLYINRILSRIMENQMLEQVLSMDYNRSASKLSTISKKQSFAQNVANKSLNETKATISRDRSKTLAFHNPHNVPSKNGGSSKGDVPQTNSESPKALNDNQKHRRHHSIHMSSAKGTDSENTSTSGSMAGIKNAWKRISVSGWRSSHNPPLSP